MNGRVALLELLPLAAVRLALARSSDLQPGRCPLCNERPEFISDPDPFKQPPPYDELVTPADLAPCVCGWQPTYFAVRYVEEISGEEWTCAEMIEKSERDRKLVEEIGLTAAVELDRQRIAALREGAAVARQ